MSSCGYSGIGSFTKVSSQSHYIEVGQVAIVMEQNMRFGLILGQLAILKKKRYASFEGVFLCFHGQFLPQSLPKPFEAGFFMFSGAKKNVKNILKTL